MSFRFRVENFNFCNKNIILSKEIYSNENIFTLITGINAVGKSRLLASLTYYFLSYEKKYDQFYDNQPEIVIAITNSLNDKFPLKKNNNKKYEYFGNKLQTSPLYNRFSVFQKIIMNKNINSQCLIDTFSYLGFHPHIKIKLKPTINTPPLFEEIKNLYDQYFIFFEREGLNLEIDLTNLKTNEIMLFYALKKVNYKSKTLTNKDFSLLCEFFLYKKGGNKKEINISYDFEFENNPQSISFYEVSILLEYDIYRIKDIQLLKTPYSNSFIDDDKKEGNLVNFNELSSGQQALLNILLAISSCIKNNSLICIDEPEISLHPRWQIEIISNLQKFFQKYTGCHFVIATHSPQVVSGLNSGNGFIVELEKNETYSSIDYSKRSSDYQLAHIFNSPGYNNEYILKVCFYLLSKIKENTHSYLDDVSFINDLNKFKANLKNDDPSLYLINQVISFYG